MKCSCIWCRYCSVTATGSGYSRWNDLAVTRLPAGEVEAGEPVELTVTYSKAGMVNGQTYLGELLLGPPSAPAALTVPIEITKVAAP
jgi:hypothetical protein